jgi:hypothetical protein
MDSSDPWAHSRGIGDALVEHFFPSFAGDREEALTFYGEGSNLYFQGSEIQGPEAIKEFLLALPPLCGLRVDGFEVQPIPTSDGSWSLIVVIGGIELKDRWATFHSSFCVQSRREDFMAFIRSHSFTWA